ncbi:MAG: fimbrillin family protein [Bacteroidaceae bacterium]|nr:fimbrillin family protein [Bacteroidaceae bacterium]
MVACSSSERELLDTNVPTIAFDAYVESAQTTRSAYDQAITDNDALKTYGFGAYGCYTGINKYLDSDVNPDFMYNECVSWDNATSTWIYSPLKYWPNGEGETYQPLVTGENPHYVSFMGYAPYHSEAGQCLYDFSEQESLGDPWLEYRLHPDVSQQVDLLYAEPLLDWQKPENHDRLPFRFHHALACVGDKVNLGICPAYITSLKDIPFSTQVEIDLTKITLKYTLTEEARLTLWNSEAKQAEPNWSLISDGTPTATRKVELTTGLPYMLYLYNKSTSEETSYTWTDTGHGVFYIPLEFDNHVQQAEVTIEFSAIFDGSPFNYSRTVAFNLSDYPEGYVHGKHLYINLSLCGTAELPALEAIILVADIAVRDWDELPDVDHEVYNW